ncbi:ABC transporter ATP-binding protein [Thermosipho ferrireducens]|uniref:ABC transporter ATP-binding protein n=1 Tax=Thermosipho ferrireducens TaxID=2571116 RepID=A0ABX7S4W9_9BACT|nr:ABC transporter ATP-binding protein [Thermosipho ferrireducens]QTA37541.1 ABC transporter ATP-binding protein [Thermosipho ferrireducens]
MKELIKWILKLPKKLLYMIGIMNLFGIFSSLIVSYTAIINKDVINYAISGNKNFFISSMLLVIAVLTSHVLFTLGKGFVSFTKGNYLKYFGEYCYKKIMNKDFSDFSKKTPAFYSEVSLRTIEDMLYLISDYNNSGGLVFAFRITFYMLTIYTLDYVSGMFMILFSILILLSLWIANIYYYKHSKIVKDKFLEVRSYVADMFRGKKETQLFEAYDFEMNLYRKNTDPVWKYKRRLFFVDFILSFSIRDLISTVFYLFIVYRGIIIGNAGTFYALLNLFALIRYQLFAAIGIWDSIRSGITSARQLEEIVG